MYRNLGILLGRHGWVPMKRENKHFNRIETQNGHLYLNNTGSRSSDEVEYTGFLKCKLVHGNGFSIVVPDLVLFNKPSHFWIQPLYLQAKYFL